MPARVLALVAALVAVLARGPTAALVGELVAALARGLAAAQWAAASSYAQAVVVDVVASARSSLAAVSKRLALECSTHMAAVSL